MSNDLKVRVCHGQALVDEIERPLRVFAGVPAVKYHRKLWPLLPGNRIDIQALPLHSSSTAAVAGRSTVDVGNNTGTVPKAAAVRPGQACSDDAIVAFVRGIELELK